MRNADCLFIYSIISDLYPIYSAEVALTLRCSCASCACLFVSAIFAYRSQVSSGRDGYASRIFAVSLESSSGVYFSSIVSKIGGSYGCDLSRLPNIQFLSLAIYERHTRQIRDDSNALVQPLSRLSRATIRIRFRPGCLRKREPLCARRKYRTFRSVFRRLCNMTTFPGSLCRGSSPCRRFLLS